MEDTPRKLRELTSEILADYALTLRMLEMRLTDDSSVSLETVESFLEWGKEEVERLEQRARLELPTQGRDPIVRRALGEFAASLEVLKRVE